MIQFERKIFRNFADVILSSAFLALYDLTGLKTSYKPEDSVNKKRLREETGPTDTGLSDFQCDIKLDDIQYIISSPEPKAHR